MISKPPNSAELRDLVRTAYRVLEASPWEILDDNHNFGVEDPESGEVAYVSVIGSGGIQRGVAVYPGTKGFETLLFTQLDAMPQERDDALLLIRSIGCMFDEPRELSPDDRKLLRDAGVQVRGPLAPSFVSYLPGYEPWALDAAEARLITHVMEQTLVVVEEFRRNPTLIEIAPVKRYLTRVPVAGSTPTAWSSVFKAPRHKRESKSEAWTPDELTLARLAKLPITNDTDWEVDAVTGMGVLAANAQQRPQILRMLMVAERPSGRALKPEAIPAPEFARSAGPAFVQTLLEAGARPRRILVRDYELRGLLAPIAKGLGCKLLRVQYLPEIDRMRDSLLEFMERNDRR
jgi:hypothetical protein